MDIRYIDKAGLEVSIDTLTEEFLMLKQVSEAVGLKDDYPGPVDYEVQQYIQRSLENGTLEIEVWN